MARIRFVLDPGKMANPDLDIRYRLPEVLAELPGSSMSDQGYDYSNDNPPMLMIFVESQHPDTDVALAVDYLSKTKLLENDILNAAVISKSNEGDNWTLMHPVEVPDT